jgi:hypothetical protein
MQFNFTEQDHKTDVSLFETVKVTIVTSLSSLSVFLCLSGTGAVRKTRAS